MIGVHLSSRLNWERPTKIKPRALEHCWRESKVLLLLWKIICQFPNKLSTHLTYIPPIPHLEIYPRRMKTYVQTKTCTQMTRTALFVTASSWK